MKTDKATARPWKYSAYHKSIQGTEVSKDGCVTKIADLDLSSFGANEENAELIVKAVNNFEGLLEACKVALRAIEDTPSDTTTVINNLEDVIKKAEEV